MKTSQKIYLSFKRLIGIIGSFVGQIAFIGLRPGSAHSEENLRECRLKYTPNAFDVKPCISGYAQIKTKREHDPEFRALWDYIYAERISFWLDVKLFVYTNLKIFGAVRADDNSVFS